MKLQQQIDEFREVYGSPPYARGIASPFDTAGRNWAVQIADSACADGLSPKDICRKLGLHPVTVQSWRAKANKQVAEVSSANQQQQDKIMDLEQKIDEFIETYGPLSVKRGGTFSYPESARIAAIEIVAFGLALGEAEADTCARLGLGRSTIYGWRRLAKASRVKARDAKSPSAKGRVRLEDITELPEVSKIQTVGGEVRVELAWGLIVTGTPNDVWEFLDRGSIGRE